MKATIELNITQLKAFVYNWENIVRAVGSGTDRAALMAIKFKMSDALQMAERRLWHRKQDARKKRAKY